jgi:uncharacterized protein
MTHEVGWNGVANHCHEIIDEYQLTKQNYEVIIGIGRGGLVPAVVFSHQLGVPLVPVMWQTRDGKPDQASTSILFGVIARIEPTVAYKQKILVVDDIADTGVTMSQVVDYLDKTQFDLNRNIDIETATIFHKPGSKFKPTYVAEEVDDAEWVIFPWEAE